MKLFHDFGIRALATSIVLGSLAYGFIELIRKLPPELTKEVTLMVVGGILSLASSITAYYFATRDRQQGGQDGQHNPPSTS